MDEILHVEHLKKHFVKKRLFGSKIRSISAADDVSFHVKKGEVFVLAGESGSGKSTIAKMILGSIIPDEGTVVFDGQDVATDGDMDRMRIECQMIHQDPYDSINPRMKIGDIISEPLEIHGLGDDNERMIRIMEVLHEVKLEPAAEIAQKYPHMLSGGQRQRVVLARALATKPRIILADEPVSMLDVSIRSEMLELMQGLQKKRDMAFVYITHDLATARYFGQRIGILYKGKIVEMGMINDVLLKPRHPYTQALLDAISKPDPQNRLRDKDIRIKEPPAGRTPGCIFRNRCPYEIERCSIEPKLEQTHGHLVACHVDLY